MAKLSRRQILNGMAVLALSSAGSAVLAACASSPEPTKAPDKPAAPAAKPTEAAKPADSAKPAAAASPTVAPAAKSSGPVQLSVASWSTRPDTRNWMTNQLVPDFEKANPGFKVEMVWHDVSKVNEQLLAAFAAGTAPDLFQGGISTFAPYYGAQGKLRDLTPYTKDWPVREDYMESSWKVGVWQGKTYALTQTHDTQVLFYRKDHFKEVGLDPNKPPTTWEELREMALKLVKREGDKVTRAGYYVPTQSFAGVQSGWWPFMVQNGGWLLTEDLTKAGVDAPGTIEAMTFYHGLLHKDKLDALGGIPTGAQVSPIVAGVVSMGTFGSGSAIYDMKKNAPDKYQDLGAAVPLKRKKQAAFLGGTAVHMTADSKRPDDTWKYLSYWCSTENLSKYATVDQQLPPMKSLLNKEPIKGDPLFEAALKTVEYGVPWPPSPKHADYRMKIVAMSEAFMLNQKSVEQAAKETAAEINEVLAKK